MSKTKKKLTKEEKLAKDRLRKKEKYEQIKNDPQLYAIQKEKERKRYLLRKEKNKISSIKNMTPREQREQRKRWRRNSKQYLKNKEDSKKIERIIIENSPSGIDIENNLDVNNQTISNRDPLENETTRNKPQITHPPLNNKVLTRKLHYKYQKIIKDLKNEILRLKKENYKLKRQRPIDNIVNDSIQKKVEEIVKDINGDRVEEVKKKLLFGETISLNLKEEYSTLNKKDKRKFVEAVLKDKERFKKYRVLKNLPFSIRPKTIPKDSITKEISNKIIKFFEEDSQSRMAAGKKEYIKKHGIKNQKRYLNDTMKNLHAKFIADNFKISYSTFCKYRPFWVVSQNSRETCQCKLHTNMELLVGALKRANIIKESSSTDVIKTICCNMSNEQCLDRSCLLCVNKKIEYKEFNNDKIYYYEWVSEKKSYEGKGGLKEANITTKKKQYNFIRNIIFNLENIMPKFMKHVCNITMQFEAIKQLKLNLKDDEILIHIDFSENYCLKYNEEIQSFHFGGSRGQVSLHTGVMYRDVLKSTVETKSFCTISQCLNHDAGAVWAHLKPILNIAKDIVAIKAIHFLSDSPTSQYRNKYIFYMLTKLKEQLKDVVCITWNYQEAGHGKGAPDGIGAVVKRTADNVVKNGGDVGSFETFLDVVTQNVKNVIIDVIQEDKFKCIKFPENIPTFKGTMNVHQEAIQMEQVDEVWTAKSSCSTVFWTTLTTFLVTLVGIITGLLLYRHYLQATSTQRYTRFCTIPIKIRDSAFYEPNYRVMPLRWSSSPDVQVFSAAADDVSDDVVDTLREEFDIGDSVEKISVLDNGRQVSFIHDFEANVTGIVDLDRCFSMQLDGGVVVPPAALLVSIAQGAAFDVSRVRAALRADLARGAVFDGYAGPVPMDLLDKCRGKPLYRLFKEDGPIIRKRSADAPSHDYIQFSGRHVQEIEITNLAELLQQEQDNKQQR